MLCKEIALFFLARSCVHPRVLPDIGAIAAKFTELNVVPMRCLPVPENEDELMLRSVEEAYSTLVLGPDTQVEQSVVNLFTINKNLSRMTPVHTQSARSQFAMSNEEAETHSEELDEFLLCHLAIRNESIRSC